MFACSSLFACLHCLFLVVFCFLFVCLFVKKIKYLDEFTKPTDYSFFNIYENLFLCAINDIGVCNIFQFSFRGPRLISLVPVVSYERPVGNSREHPDKLNYTSSDTPVLV